MGNLAEQNQQSYKIIITGAFLSGKSSFIRAISEVDLDAAYKQAINNHSHSTVWIEFGLIEVQGAKFYLFPSPNTLRFPLLFDLGDDFLGYVIMVDSSLPESFTETRGIISTFTTYIPRPFVIAANKQDKPYAWDVEALRIALRVSDEIPIVPCIAHDKKSVANVLIALCEEILKNIESNEAES